MDEKKVENSFVFFSFLEWSLGIVRFTQISPSINKAHLVPDRTRLRKNEERRCPLGEKIESEELLLHRDCFFFRLLLLLLLLLPQQRQLGCARAGVQDEEVVRHADDDDGVEEVGGHGEGHGGRPRGEKEGRRRKSEEEDNDEREV